jgi:hypothetical protein
MDDFVYRKQILSFSECQRIIFKCGFKISKIKDLDPLSNLGKIVNPISLILKNKFRKE